MSRNFVGCDDSDAIDHHDQVIKRVPDKLLVITYQQRGDGQSFRCSINLLKYCLEPDVDNLAGQLAQLLTVLSSLAKLAPASTTAGLEDLEVESNLDLPVSNLRGVQELALCKA